MRWRRNKTVTPASRDTRSTGPHDDVAADTGSDAASVHTGTFAHGLVADDAVLVELSRAFADDDTTDSGEERPAGSVIDPGLAPDPPKDADSGSAPPPPAGRTIVIGGDDLPALDDLPAGRDRSGGSDRSGDRDPALGRDASDPAKRPIAIGSDDDLPDAVYLDEELERDSSDPVFIDDDGTGDAVLAHAAPGMEPRLRQRRIGVRRAETRRRLWWVGLAGVVMVVVISLLAVLGSSLFAVDEVTVSGNVYTDADALAAIVDELEGTPVLLVDTADVEAQLEAIPYVERARVRTDFPDAATIDLRERVPVAAMTGADGQVRVLDSEGRVLALVDGQPVALVWIAGPGTLDIAPGQFASVGYSSAASLVTKFTPNIRSRVDSLLVTPDGGDLVLVLRSEFGPIEVRFGSAIGDNNQIEKLVRLERALDDTADRLITVIDVSTSEVTIR